ncbi:hypothetical protein CAMRE0001_2711 [Campylobacter rectus RM3267]|uniref:Uncharacterized protein n=1 Tax=Campylobacter rectus RM3267 TaxID=553218 RepID=B9D0R5_CAMRE|nr:hypothetical protein CAMRE0001_2711 [Campylobacter rectus RM3267]
MRQQSYVATLNFSFTAFATASRALRAQSAKQKQKYFAFILSWRLVSRAFL